MPDNDGEHANDLQRDPKAADRLGTPAPLHDPREPKDKRKRDKSQDNKTRH